MSALRLAAATTVLAALLALPATAQQTLPRPKDQPAPPAKTQQKAPPKNAPAAAPPQQQQAAPAGPYKAVMVSEPKPFVDEALAAFRKELAAAAQKKDRAALAKLVLAQGFFWMKERGDAADKRKPGAETLAVAFNLAARDSQGWDALAQYAGDESASPMQGKPGVMCAPAGPTFNQQELDEVIKATQTDFGDWGFISAPNIEVRQSAAQNAPVIEKLGIHFVRVMPDMSPNASQEFLRIVTPSGKVGFVPGDAVNPIGSEQICYMKDKAGAWKIAGIIGGE
jgi:hypothetical protein